MDKIDRVFFINLDKRVDRLEEFLGEFKKMNIPDNKLERFPAIYEPSFTCWGCTKSHLNVLKIARERQYKNILIFEDDFELLVSGETFVQNIEKFFSLGLDFKVLMLSYNIQDTPIPVNDVVGITHNVQTASGYLVNMEYIGELIDCIEYGSEMLKQTGHHWLYVNDQIWKKLQQDDKWYYFLERIGKQRKSFSELSRSVVDYNV